MTLGRHECSVTIVHDAHCRQVVAKETNDLVPNRSICQSASTVNKPFLGTVVPHETGALFSLQPRPKSLGLVQTSHGRRVATLEPRYHSHRRCKNGVKETRHD